MKCLLAFFFGALLSAWAAPSRAEYPEKRVLTPEQRQSLGPLEAVLLENFHGVAKGWARTDTTEKGAEWGPIGEAVAATKDAVANLGPERRAQRAADRLDAITPAAWLDATLAKRLADPRLMVDHGAGLAVTVKKVSIERVTTLEPLNGVVQVAASYLLTDDARTFYFGAHVQYASDRIKYTSPYPFRGKTPAYEMRGPAYKNTFVYRSSQLPIPMLTPELQARLIADIEADYRDASGVLPEPDTREGKALKKELELARDADLSRNELSMLLTAHWLENDGALLRSEIERAHSFFITHLVKDLNDSTIPSYVGADETLQAEEDRVVLRLGSGRKAGYIVSTPGGTADVFDFGNARAIAAGNEKRMNAAVDEKLKEEKARKSKRPR